MTATLRYEHGWEGREEDAPEQPRLVPELICFPSLHFPLLSAIRQRSTVTLIHKEFRPYKSMRFVDKLFHPSEGKARGWTIGASVKPFHPLRPR